MSGTDKFKTLAAKVAQAAAEAAPADLDALKAAEVEGETVEAVIQNGIATMGENMTLTRFVRRSTEAGAISSYIHMGGKTGVLVEFAFEKPETACSDEFAKAHHAACAGRAATASHLALAREDMPQSVVDHEMEIYRNQAAESGKPEAIQEKMALGRLEKFYKESTLVDQEFVKNPDVTISQYVAEVSKKVGDTIAVKGFDLFILGDED